MPPRGEAGGFAGPGGFAGVLGLVLGLALGEALADAGGDDVLAAGDGLGDAADACAAQGSSSTPAAMNTAPASAAARRRQPADVGLVRIRVPLSGG
jgi:hypothetical protein